MEIDVRPNSNKSKEERIERQQVQVAHPPKTNDSKPKPTAVAVKPSVGNRFKNAVFNKENLETVGDKIVSDLVIPGVQDLTTNLFQTITDIFMETVKTVIYGDDEPSYVNARNNGYRNYNAISSGGKNSSKSYGSMTRTGGNSATNYNHVRSTGFVNYALPSRIDIDKVSKYMYDVANDFDGFVSVASYYEYLIDQYDMDIEPAYTDEKWGWFENDLDRAKPRRVREGWLFDLPNPKPLD